MTYIGIKTYENNSKLIAIQAELYVLSNKFDITKHYCPVKVDK